MKGIGFVNAKTSPQEMNLHSFYMNEKYANAFTRGLKSNAYVE